MTQRTHPRPALTMSPADVAAHRASSYVRATNPGDSDPDADEALRRARANFGICPFCGKPDTAGHACASTLPHRTPGRIRYAVEIDHAYRQRTLQLRANVTAERALAGAL